MVEGNLPHKVVTPPEKSRRLALQLVFALVIFLSGAIVGTGGTMNWFKSHGWRPPRVGPVGIPETDNLVQEWATKYGLTDEQGVQVRQVLDDTMQTRRTIFDALRNEMDAVEELMVEKIKTIMTEDQYTQWLAEYEKRKKRHGGSREGGGRRGRGGGGGGGRGRGPRDPNRGPSDRPPRAEEGKPATD
ncbi:hypothetical protein ACFL6U_20600 [Planctomycetota bacterium]